MSEPASSCPPGPVCFSVAGQGQDPSLGRPSLDWSGLLSSFPSFNTCHQNHPSWFEKLCFCGCEFWPPVLTPKLGQILGGWDPCLSL